MNQNHNIDTLQVIKDKIYQISKNNNTDNLKIVIQANQDKLNQIFLLTQQLRKIFIQSKFYTLYDSMKNSCCVDLIGARHVDYDLLIHFGFACFSQKYDSKHYYLFDKKQEQINQNILKNLELSHQTIIKQNIECIISQQPFYNITKIYYQQLLQRVCKFCFDAQDNEQQYFSFGYYKSKKCSKKNIVIICQNQDSELIQYFSLSKGSLEIQNIYLITPKSGIYLHNINTNKKIMQRLSLANQIKNYQIFGLCVSNPSTQYCQKSLSYCQQVLIKNNKKSFIFMMNNLNEAKLGNFPQIEAYIIISCFNHSLYTSKKFHKVVITLFDLQLSFDSKNIDQYCFDLRNIIYGGLKQNIIEQSIQENKKQSQQLQIENIQNNVILYKSIQTLDVYKEKIYKGLTYTQKKQIKKISKGKIGLAQHYQPILQ